MGSWTRARGRRSSSSTPSSCEKCRRGGRRDVLHGSPACCAARSLRPIGSCLVLLCRRRSHRIPSLIMWSHEEVPEHCAALVQIACGKVGVCSWMPHVWSALCSCTRQELLKRISVLFCTGSLHQHGKYSV